MGVCGGRSSVKEGWCWTELEAKSDNSAEALWEYGIWQGRIMHSEVGRTCEVMPHWHLLEDECSVVSWGERRVGNETVQFMYCRLD